MTKKETEYDVFLSYYSGGGYGFAEHLWERLPDLGMRAFLNKKNIPKKIRAKSVEWREWVDKAIINSKIFVLIMTIGFNTRKEVLRELKVARNNNIDIIYCRYKNLDKKNVIIKINNIEENLSKLENVIFKDEFDLFNQLIDEFKNMQMKKKVNKVISISEISNRVFEYDKFKSNLYVLKELPISKSKYELLYRMRHQLTDLPWNGFSDNQRTLIQDFLMELKKIINKNDFKELSLEMLKIICSKRDIKINDYIRDFFLANIITSHHSYSLNAKRHSLQIQQMLMNYDNKFIINSLFDSIFSWSEDEFKILANSLDTYRLDEQNKTYVKKRLWKYKVTYEENKKIEQNKKLEILRRIKIYLDKDEFK